MHDIALIWGTRRVTWAQLDTYCAAAVGQLRTLGLKSGERVAVCAPTAAEYIIVILSLWRMGVSVAPINPRLPPQQVASFASSLNAVLFLTTAQLRQTFSCVPVRTLVLNEIVNFDARHAFNFEIKTWQPQEDQELTIIATSGSSGQPKPAVLTWGNHYYNALGANQVIPLGNQDRWLLCLPLFHVSGMSIIIRAMITKAAIVVPVEDDLSQTISRRQVTHVSLVSTQMHRLLASVEGIEALKGVKYILLGGSAIPAELIKKSCLFGLNVFISYGLTEMASQVATGRAQDGAKILPYRELMIGPHGEILVKGKTLFKGYFQAGKLNLPLNNEGWFDTGDCGEMDAAGNLKVLGRRDEMFISGGENVHPEEIERVLLGIEGIIQAVVVPKEDREFGFRPVAFIEQEPDGALRVDQIIAVLHEHLPSFKIPVMFFPWPRELMTHGIKISRKDFKQKLHSRR